MRTLKKAQRNPIRVMAVMLLAVLIVIGTKQTTMYAYTNVKHADIVMELEDSDVEVVNVPVESLDGRYYKTMAMVKGELFGKKNRQVISNSSNSAGLSDDTTYLVVNGRNTYLFLSDDLSDDVY